MVFVPMDDVKFITAGQLIVGVAPPMVKLPNRFVATGSVIVLMMSAMFKSPIHEGDATAEIANVPTKPGAVATLIANDSDPPAVSPCLMYLMVPTPPPTTSTFGVPVIVNPVIVAADHTTTVDAAVRDIFPVPKAIVLAVDTLLRNIPQVSVKLLKDSVPAYKVTVSVAKASVALADSVTLMPAASI
jgi:hypothetical protein